MPNGKFSFPQLSESGERWYVFYTKVEPFRKNKRVKVYGDINAAKNLEEKQKRADALLAQVLKELGEGVERKTISSVKETFDSAAARFVEAKKDSWRQKTFQTYTNKIKHFSEWLATHSLNVFTANEAQAFSRHLTSVRKASSVTHNGYIAILSAIFDEMDTEVNPWKKVKKLKENKTPARYFNSLQKKKLKDHISTNDAQLWLACRFMYYCYIRPSEMRMLRISDIDPDTQTIAIRASIAKNKKTQSVVIPDVFWEEILETDLLNYPSSNYIFSQKGLPGARPIKMDSLARRHKEALIFLGFDTEEYKFYSWKHTGAVAFLKENRGTMKELQLQLRHASLEETDGYLRQLKIENFDGVKTKTQKL